MIKTSDPDLCGVGSDVLCWIEPTAEEDSTQEGMVAFSTPADSSDISNGDLDMSGIGAGDASIDSGWLSFDPSGLTEGVSSDNGMDNLWNDESKAADASIGLLDGSQEDYSIFSR